MAKITTPDIPPELAQAAAITLRVTTSGAQQYARRWFALPAPDSSTQLRQQARVAACALSWNALRAWKRTRWTICAYRNGVPANAPDGVQNFAGFSLYLRCWIDQNIVSPHEPISPCARRVTDPGASPFDFTP
jgi:hypothetical protein